VVTLVSTTVVAGVIDVLAGRTLLVGEVHHLAEILAMIALWRLTRPASPSWRRAVASL
jgi:hypothetical protein